MAFIFAHWYSNKNVKEIEIYDNTPFSFEEEEETIYYDSIDLNTATVEELDNLMYIGREQAEAIVRYREENGDFESVEDVGKVEGITIIMEEVINNSCFIG